MDVLYGMALGGLAGLGIVVIMWWALDAWQWWRADTIIVERQDIMSAADAITPPSVKVGRKMDDATP